MNHPDFTILFVDQPLASAQFYRDLLGVEPVENSPTFSLFVLSSGLKLGLWSRQTALPPVAASGGAVEIGLRVDSMADVDRLFADWDARGLPILQAPVNMDFGYTFTMADPDGHRLRVYAMAPRG